jgi:general L-amino acid transport system permease protein
MIEARSSPPENVLPPPVERYTVLGWMYKNLFSSWFNAVLTFAALGLVYAIVRPVLTWAATQARWEVVLVNIRLLMVGQYPVAELWRVWLCLHLLAAVGGLSWGIWVRGYRVLGVLVLTAPLAVATLSAIRPPAAPHRGGGGRWPASDWAGLPGRGSSAPS